MIQNLTPTRTRRMVLACPGSWLLSAAGFITFRFVARQSSHSQERKMTHSHSDTAADMFLFFCKLAHILVQRLGNSVRFYMNAAKKDHGFFTSTYAASLQDPSLVTFCFRFCIQFLYPSKWPQCEVIAKDSLWLKTIYRNTADLLNKSLVKPWAKVPSPWWRFFPDPVPYGRYPPFGLAETSMWCHPIRIGAPLAE